MPTIESLVNSPTLLTLLLIASFIVGLSKGGLPGIGMLSVPLLSLAMSPITAAILLLPIYILSDVVGIYLYRKEYSKDNLITLIPAGIAGVIIGWQAASIISEEAVSALIGWLGVVFCLNLWIRTWLLKNQSPKPKLPSIKKGIFWGILSGFTSFISHAGAPPYQVYILPQQLPKMVFAGTTTILFAVVNFAKIIPYSALQPYNWSTATIAALLLPLAAAGTFVGKYLIQQLNDKLFYLIVQIALFIISIKLVVNSLH